MDGTKLYSTRGCIARPGKGEFLPGQEMIVAVTKDPTKCTVSITNRELYFQFVIPFGKILKELNED